MSCAVPIQNLALSTEVELLLVLLEYTAVFLLGIGLALSWNRRTRHSDAARRRARDLEQALDQRDRLMENTVHELRTPLTTVMASIDILRSGYAVTEDERQMLYDQTAAAGHHLLFLINDLLDAAALRAGQLRIECEPCVVARVLEEAVRTMTPVAAARSCTLAMRCDDPTLQVMADPNRLLQVLFNLTGNALKFSPHREEVELRASAGASGIRIEVRDSGIGVPPAARKALFARFSRVHTSQASNAPGTGLGLELCRELVERMDGRIGYRPRRSGTGSVFWFSLPAAPAPKQAATGAAPAGGTPADGVPRDEATTPRPALDR